MPEELVKALKEGPLDLDKIEDKKDKRKSVRVSRPKSPGILSLTGRKFTESTLLKKKSKKEESSKSTDSLPGLPSSSKSKSGTKSFTFLVRRGEKDFPTKVIIETSSMTKLLSKLQKRFKFGSTATLLYLDADFSEYVRFPKTIDKLPEKAKIMILENNEEKK